MTNNKQQTAVQLIIQALDIECKSRGMNVNWDMYLKMEKEQITQAWKKGDGQFDKVSDKMSLEYYEKTYGGNDE